MVVLDEGKIFLFPDFSKKHFYLLIFVLCSLIRRLLPFLIDKWEEGKVINPDFNKSCVFDMISNFITDFSTGIYKLIICIKDKKHKKRWDEDNENEYRGCDSDIAAIKKKEAKERKKKFYSILITIAIVDIVAQLCLLIFSFIDKKGCTLNFSDDCAGHSSRKINEDDLIFTVALNIIFRYIFSRLFLTIYIYYHHLISMIVTMVSFIPLIIFNIKTLNQKETNSNLIIYIILNIIMTILYAFEDVMNKIALTKLIIRPYEIMFFKSLFQLPLFLIIFISIYIKDSINTDQTVTIITYIKNNSHNWY